MTCGGDVWHLPFRNRAVGTAIKVTTTAKARMARMIFHAFCKVDKHGQKSTVRHAGSLLGYLD